MGETWRSAHPLPHRTPFAPQVCIPLGRLGKSFLLQTTMYRLEPLYAPPNINQDPSISSSKGWLIMLGESESVPLRLLNPFTSFPVPNTPQTQIFSSDTLPRVLNSMNFKVVKVLEAFNLSSKCNASYPLKLVLFPSFPVEGRMVCALFSSSNLCVRKMGDKKWTKIKLIYYQGFHGYCDIIIHTGQLYVIDDLGTIFLMNPLSMELVRFTQPLRSWYNGKSKNMVEFDGRLGVVEKHIRGRSLPLEVDITVVGKNHPTAQRNYLVGYRQINPTTLEHPKYGRKIITKTINRNTRFKVVHRSSTTGYVYWRTRLRILLLQRKYYSRTQAKLPV
ncbi:hypothetical protein OROGR_018012 [Orobanche gracilis]